MFITETFLKGKKDLITTCEDGFYADEHYAVMIDGATSKSGLLVNGKTTGRYIMEIIRDNIAYIKPGLSAKEFLKSVEGILVEHYKKDKVLGAFIENEYSVPEANMVVFSRDKMQLWFFGDAQAMVDGKLYENKKYIDEITSAVRKLVLEYHLLQGEKIEALRDFDKGVEFIAPLLKMQLSFRDADIDSPFRYSTVSGFGMDEADIKVYDLPEHSKEIVLATDGYPKLFMTLKETEEHLKRINATDPMAFKENVSVKGILEGFNSFDDRAYMKIKL